MTTTLPPRFEPFAVPGGFRGPLAQLPLPEILQFLSTSGATGILSMVSGGARKAIFVRNGRVVFGSSNLPNDRLGEILIRDGKITSEKIWMAGGRDGADQDAEQTPEEAAQKYIYEVTVLDSAGRLQVPKEFLEKFNIKGRAKLELTDGGILVRSFGEGVATQSAEDLVSEPGAARRSRTLRHFVNQLISRLH